MAMTNINIRTDEELKKDCEQLFEDLGLNMTTAINIFLRQALRVGGIPFEVKLDNPPSGALPKNQNTPQNGKYIKKIMSEIAEISETETLTIYDFSLADINFRIAFTKQIANKHTVVHCKSGSISLEQLRPLGIKPISEVSFVCKHSDLMMINCRSILVISGKPDIICDLDEGSIASARAYATNPSSKLLYVMSEMAFNELLL